MLKFESQLLLSLQITNIKGGTRGLVIFHLYLHYCGMLHSHFALTICLQMQLRKEGRRNEYEKHKLQALNQRQKMVYISKLFNDCFVLLNNIALDTL